MGGITSREERRQDLAVARDFRPMTEAGLQDLLAETNASGSEGRYERFKTTTQLDAGYHRQPHGV